MALVLAIPNRMSKGILNENNFPMSYSNNTLDFLTVLDVAHNSNGAFLESTSTDITFIWNTDVAMDIVVNRSKYRLTKNEIIMLTNHHSVNVISFKSARLIKFDLSFFGSNDPVENDLKGALFFNVTNVPIVSISENELHTFENLWEVFRSEMKSRDNMQYAMLQSILKRITILCTRKLKNESSEGSGKKEADVLREYRFLVENYFSKHHGVAFYASMLNKSPKTLSNLFSSLSGRTPIDIIHERIMTQARMQIFHTTKPIKEIAYDLGYEDIQTFSRFFKNKEGLSPIQYRQSVQCPEAKITMA